ncbi:hypothetical protein GW17_00059512, partial [Ensete ventricosum]
MLSQDQAWASGQGLDNTVGPRWEFARSSPKGSGNSLGTHPEVAKRRPYDLPQEYRRLLDWQ